MESIIEKFEDGEPVNAIFATLNCKAISHWANSLIKAVELTVIEHEIAHAKRSNKRISTRSKLTDGLEAFLGNLLLSFKATPEGWCYRSLNKGAFTGERVGFRIFSGAVESLRDLGLVEHQKGTYRFSRDPLTGGAIAAKAQASRFRATPRLLGLAEGSGVELGSLERHFIEDLPQRPLVLRDKSQRQGGEKHKGATLKVEPTAKSKAIEAQVREINEFLDTFDICGGAHRGYRRIFNKESPERFDWNQGGRLYGGESSYQRLPKAKRRLMTIDGAPVVEVDISASYLTMLHALQGVPMDTTKDPYTVDGFEGAIGRAVVKSWTTATLGNNKHLKRWPTETAKSFKEKTGRNLKAIASTSDVRKAMVARHPILETWDEQEITWADLMFHESEAVIGAITELMRQGIPSLAVHDSLIVRAFNESEAIFAIRESYFKVAGVYPKISVSRD